MYRVSSFAFTEKKRRHCHLEDTMKKNPEMSNNIKNGN